MIRTQLGILYGQGFPGIFAEYTDLITLTAAEIRSLNTVQIAILPAPGAHKIIVPKDVILIAKPGTVVFSASVTPDLLIPLTGAAFDLLLTAGAFDGSADVVQPFTVVTADYKADYVSSLGVNSALYLASGADVTGGTGASLSLILTYQIIDLSGLV